ncbi:MAG: S8 family serine peptidase, partial [Limnobacter sp.]|nr:S8 family serine peptidase [Limnobacter sp.]
MYSALVRSTRTQLVSKALLFAGFAAFTPSLVAQTEWIVNVEPEVPVEDWSKRLETTVGASALTIERMLQPGSWRVRWDESAQQPLNGDWRALGGAIRSIPGVVFAAPDWHLVRASAAQPTDSTYALDQSPYMGQVGAYAMRLPDVWVQTRGSSDSVVAVLDSGVLFGHPDLQGKLLPGYDFVSDASPPTGSDSTDRSLRGSSDGDGRDPDPSDPGDAPPNGLACDSGQLESSFHGTSVSSVVAAQSDNSAFVTGVDWNAKILPVRVSGRCGVALVSDLIDGMYWANQAGDFGPGVPENPFKADVINLSFAAQESLVRSCSSASGEPMVRAIQDSVRAGVPVIVSAGNTGGDLGFPASCPQAIAAAAITPSGQIAGYSSRGMVNN